MIYFFLSQQLLCLSIPVLSSSTSVLLIHWQDSEFSCSL